MIICSIALTQRSFSDEDSDKALSMELENSVIIPKTWASKKLTTMRLVFALGLEWLGFPSTNMAKIWIACCAWTSLATVRGC